MIWFYHSPVWLWFSLREEILCALEASRPCTEETVAVPTVLHRRGEGTQRGWCCLCSQQSQPCVLECAVRQVTAWLRAHMRVTPMSLRIWGKNLSKEAEQEAKKPTEIILNLITLAVLIINEILCSFKYIIILQVIKAETRKANSPWKGRIRTEIQVFWYISSAYSSTIQLSLI